MNLQLTKQYIQAFSAKDISAVAKLLHDEFSLEDPVVKHIVGKEKCLLAIQDIFNSCEELNFFYKNLYEQGNTTIIEFVLILGESRLEGVDIIEWKDNKMSALRAYLDTPK